MNPTLYNEIMDLSMIENNWNDMSEEERNVAMELAVQNHTASVEKIQHLLGWIANREGFTVAAKREEERIREARKQAEAIIDRVRAGLQAYMEQTGTDKLEAGTWKLSMRKSPPSVEITDEAAVPAEFIVIEKKIRKQEIKDAIKAGAIVPGAILKEGSKSLTIR